MNAERFYRTEPKFYAMRVCQRLEPEVNLFEHLCQVHLLPVHSQHPRFGASQEQQPFHQVSDPVDLFQGALQGCPVFLRRSCRTQNNLQFAFQNGEGSLKLMGGIGTEPADLAECGIQTGEHLVQGFGQIVQFIACSRLIHTLAKVFGAYPAGSGCHPVHGLQAPDEPEAIHRMRPAPGREGAPPP